MMGILLSSRAPNRKKMEFLHRNIWITGASSGIGKAVAVELSKSTANLILSGRNEEALQEVASACRANGSTAVVIPFDLENMKDVIRAAKEVKSRGTKLDALYHFGGISQRSFVHETSMEVDRKIFEVNFFGTIALTKALLPWMIENGGGHIAVTSSIVGKFGFPWRSAYSASKHALHGFFESLRAENKENNLRVSIVIPGRIKTNISVNALNRNGNHHGKMDEGQVNGMLPERAAAIICKKLKKEKKEILVGGKEVLMVHIRRFLPFLYYHLASKVKPL